MNDKMKSQPLVSILMNCYNGSEYLEEAINSIYDQTYHNWEIIFIDNGSTDTSRSIAMRYDNRLKYHRLNSTKPLGKARNYGLQYVLGQYLAFLDTDDMWLPDKLMKQVHALEKNKEYTFSYSGIYYIDENRKIIGRKKAKCKSGFIFPQLLKHYEINMQSALVRFDERHCYFNEERLFSPDFEMFMRISSKHKAYVFQDYMVYYRKLKSSLTMQKIDKWWIEHNQTIESLVKSDKELAKQYSNEIRLARAKVLYYKALYEYYIGNDKQARADIKKTRFIKWDYFSLYVLSLMPFNLWRRLHRLIGKVQYK